MLYKDPLIKLFKSAFSSTELMSEDFVHLESFSDIRLHGISVIFSKYMHSDDPRRPKYVLEIDDNVSGPEYSRWLKHFKFLLNDIRSNNIEPYARIKFYGGPRNRVHYAIVRIFTEEELEKNDMEFRLKLARNSNLEDDEKYLLSNIATEYLDSGVYYTVLKIYPRVSNMMFNLDIESDDEVEKEAPKSKMNFFKPRIPEHEIISGLADDPIISSTSTTQLF